MMPLHPLLHRLRLLRLLPTKLLPAPPLLRRVLVVAEVAVADVVDVVEAVMATTLGRTRSSSVQHHPLLPLVLPLRPRLPLLLQRLVRLLGRRVCSFR